jgi:hypothetical protein
MSSIDLHDGALYVTGIGYLRRIKVGTAPGDTPFVACDILALAGKPGGSRALRRFDAIVLGPVAQALIGQCQASVRSGRQVLVRFCMRDVKAHIFTHKKGEKAGQRDACLKSYLLWVYWIKVDGEYTYQAEPTVSDSADDADDTSDLDDLDDLLP